MGFSRVNLALACVWLLVAFAVGREYARKTRALQDTAVTR
jgi:hypothetical protein